MGQRGETQLDDLLGALADLTLNTQTHQSDLPPPHRTPPCDSSGYSQLSYLDLWGEGRQVEGEHGRGSGGQKVDAVQAAVRGAFGPVRLHDAFKMAAEGIEVAV